MSRPEKRWNILPPDRDAARAIARQTGVAEITAQLLINRGISDPDTARAFLQPELSHLHDPSLLPEFDRAADRIRRAVEKGERIVIYGDYDVDGISATAILLRCMALLGAQAEFYVPNRLEEGYGLNAAAVAGLADAGTNLIVTVDCGISAVEEVRLARELGMDVIVTDHHEPGEEVPTDAILINPKLPGCPYPFRGLSGAGVAFKLAWAVGKRSSNSDRVSKEFRDFLVDAVTLAALGTIADVVPLQAENRVLAHFGLRGIAGSSAPGMIALREAASLADKHIGAGDVAFRIAPRLNAAGRVGSAGWAVELLTTSSLDRAREIAAQLNKENSRRQRIQEQILTDALAMIEEAGGVEEKHTILLAKEGWHSGVVGIVASRLTELYWRPTILLTLEGDMGHGSARAVAPLNLFATLQECSGHLTAFGGHARAAGLRLKRDDLPAFADAFERAAADRLSAEDLTPVIDIDAEARLCDIDRGFVDDLERMAPFGEGNAEPLIASFDVTLPSGARRMGTGGRHLNFYANQNGAAVRAVAFGMGELEPALSRAPHCAIAYVPRINRYRGFESVELDVRDIKIAE